MKKIIHKAIFFSALIIPFVCISQTNIMTVDWKKLTDLESRLQLGLRAASMGVHFSLKDTSIEDWSYYVNGCKKSEGKGIVPIEQAIIGFKNDKNLIWTYYFALVYDKDGRYTDSAYAGYTKTEFGEQTDEYLIKVKKKRLFPENNIFTESIMFPNGLTFIIEDKIFVRRVVLPTEGTLNVKKYYYEDCSTR